MIKKIWQDFWKFSIDMFSVDAAKGGIEGSKAVLELAQELHEHRNISELKPIVSRISSLLDVLNSPIAQVLGAGIPFISIGADLLQFYLQKTQKEASLEECVAIISQAAYLESFIKVLQWPENKPLLEHIQDTPADPSLTKRIRNLGETLEVDGQIVELSEREAKESLLCFHESKLAKAFNPVLKARLHQAGLDEEQAHILTQRISHNTHRYMVEALAAAKDNVQRLSTLYLEGWRWDIKKYQSIDKYLSEQIAPMPLDKVFNENFAFKDIYVSLQVKPVKTDGQVDHDAKSFDLEHWARTQLQRSDRQDQVMFVQGGPGRGKSVFCRMFADWVRQNLYPIWIPILIRLRDIRTLEKDFEKTLKTLVGRDFSASDNGWLTDCNTRFLFLLDGFDELLMEGRTSEGLEQFLKQVGGFQERCQQNTERGHRVLITGRPLTLQSIERYMPPNLDRVEIIPMNSTLQEHWFRNWANQVGISEAQTFWSFLQDEQCPEQVRKLAQEPLLLYLLGAMHRDKQFAIDMFKDVRRFLHKNRNFQSVSDSAWINTKIPGKDISGNGLNSSIAKILIYQRSLDWVLTKQRSTRLTRDLTELSTEGLRHVLIEAAFCATQFGGEAAPIRMLEERLEDDDDAIELIKQARKRLGVDALRNALATFYVQSASKQGGSVEFIHKSFSEYLCAERIQQSLEEWTKPSPRGYRFDTKQSQLDWEIYDLFGFGRLSPEILEYIRALWEVSENFNAKVLFKRLEFFYTRWCSGEFINILKKTTLPQQKGEQIESQGISIGQRQVDIYTGLNILILLLELHRYGQSQDNSEDLHFYPCRQQRNERESPLNKILVSEEQAGYRAFLDKILVDDYQIFDKKCLLRIISYSQSSPDCKFQNIVGRFLCSADLRYTDFHNADLHDVNLRGADLRGTNLTGVDLSHASLIDATLIGTYLNGANLSSANLSNADLTRTYARRTYFRGANLSSATLNFANFNGTDLRDASLRDADLSGTSLHGAYLRDANLSGANLSGANLTSANLLKIIWDKKTNWEGIKGIENAVNVPKALKQQLSLVDHSPS
ncbi:pentapeptide repeat-containing protein [Leptothoe spongobia]|uniref:Pentapeptide repeat-containing protein n=1 Tax=Leptothoe spongobia TAU-MAC 1115 TaxID=1967444 RepID=A0A947DG74_9CYAN|nr:pentapeptide repeat-containing protein [Leptothoe spongobia]MBT9316069.1 pentapeptide repeat-containing protein [Leptothoe spongobia TAU-MAC 1115]